MPIAALAEAEPWIGKLRSEQASASGVRSSLLGTFVTVNPAIFTMGSLREERKFSAQLGAAAKADEFFARVSPKVP